MFVAAIRAGPVFYNHDITNRGPTAISTAHQRIVIANLSSSSDYRMFISRAITTSPVTD